MKSALECFVGERTTIRDFRLPTTAIDDGEIFRHRLQTHPVNREESGVLEGKIEQRREGEGEGWDIKR